ncbi:MAG: leucine-rich repeat domain-containing protein [Chitinispirillales bacterium]|jgi:hypothetical protein|nr:leucine-rich repeat domain-containing protein [Chitinispirillales bacterium]
MGMAIKHIRTTYTTVIFITVFFVVVGCGDGKKAGAEANLTGEALTNNVGGVRTWNCGDSGGNVIATLKDNGMLIVSGMRAMADYDYHTGFPPWHDIKDSITNVVIEHGITSIGNEVFEGCTSLISISIPNSVKRIGNHAFMSCSNLTSVMIPNSVTYIGFGVFCCTGLTSVTIPDSVKRIREGTFAICENLMSVIISGSVTYIEPFAFNGCINLISVSIPNNVREIGMSAFEACNGLTSIIVQNPTPPQLGICAFRKIDENGDVIEDKACLYVPANNVAAYRVAEEWKKFKCIKPLESVPAGTK